MQLLLLNIKEKCLSKNLDKVIDLCDVSGSVANLRLEAFKNQYAIAYLKPRQTLVLLEVQTGTTPNSVKFIPLLENSEIVNEDFLQSLTPQGQQKPKKKGLKSTNSGSNSNLASSGDLSQRRQSAEKLAKSKKAPAKTTPRRKNSENYTS